MSKSHKGDADQAKGHLHIAATLTVNGIGVVALIGILLALMTGQDYHPLVILAACIYLLLRPLLYWFASRTKRTTDKNVPS